MDNKPRLAKDIDLAEVNFLARGREFEYAGRDILLRKLACAIELGSYGRFYKLKEEFRREYGDFNEYEIAGLDKIQEEYMAGDLRK